MCDLENISEVKIMNLRDGDIIVFKSPKPLTQDIIDALIEQTQAHWPAHKVVVLEDGLDLEIVKVETVPA